MGRNGGTLVIEDLKMALDYTRRAKMTKPPCPVLTAAALALYTNVRAEIDRQITTHEQWIADELAGD